MRGPLNELLRRYAQLYPAEAGLAARFSAFAAAHRDCLWRHCGPGHITASAWIVDAEGARALLLWHKKLHRWLQPGGHVDGEAAVERAALREAREETGIEAFELATRGGVVVPLDLDVHPIPAHGREGPHRHWDLRFLLRAPACGQPVRSPESLQLRWCGDAEVAALTQEESVLRLLRKARQWLPACGWQPA